MIFPDRTMLLGRIIAGVDGLFSSSTAKSSTWGYVCGFLQTVINPQQMVDCIFGTR